MSQIRASFKQLRLDLHLFLQNLTVQSSLVLLFKLLIVISLIVFFQYAWLYLFRETTFIMLKQLWVKVGPSFSLMVILGSNVFLAQVVLEKVFSINAVNYFKSFVVKITPTKVFLDLAAILPIGSWLEYETQDRSGKNALIKVVERNDEILLDKILKYASKAALYKYLKEKAQFDKTALHIAADILSKDKQKRLMQKLILAIEPEIRCSFLINLEKYGFPFMFHIMGDRDNDSSDVDFILKSIPEEDRWKFITQQDKNGNSLITYLGRRDDYSHALVASLKINALLKHVPSEKLFEFLCFFNNKGKTALICLADWRDEYGLCCVLEKVPKDRLQEFLLYKKQGQRALECAYTADNKGASVEVLRKYRLTLPEGYCRKSIEELKKVEDLAIFREKFKEKTGEYPEDVLGLYDLWPPKAAIIQAYRIKARQVGPDDQKGEADNGKFHKVQDAYEFYIDEVKRNSYLRHSRFYDN